MSDSSTESADRVPSPVTGLTVLGSADAGRCADGVCAWPPPDGTG